MLKTNIFSGAIKFGDHLSQAACARLLQQLSECGAPFQCAHGRPSVVPVINVAELSDTTPEVERMFKMVNLKALLLDQED